MRKLLLGAMSASLLVGTPAMAARDWAAVKSWAYQLTNYKDGKLDEIGSAGFDLVVIDLARDGGSDFFRRAEVETVQQKGVIVLAYFEIGAIENYRPEWKAVPEDLKLGAVKGWPRERLVKFWDERWWPIVQGRVDQALKSGFDGAYLDMVTAYEEAPAREMKREELARRMVALISRVSQYAKAANPQFKIVPQNAPELYTWAFWEPRPNEEYLQAIDGLGLEDVFYLAHDKPAQMKWCEENRQNALAIRKAGKLVLGVDYAKTPACIADAYARQRALGFVPYVSVVSLDRVLQEHATGMTNSRPGQPRGK
ncbi:MAG TPA: endo alpha-1,4 polygalactosaminidase [Candidatus Acidoferrum sp.]|nr:endo alpha-1,4 polygalactosaminidase [Candidatus Acidoferrum sp.]